MGRSKRALRAGFISSVAAAALLSATAHAQSTQAEIDIPPGDVGTALQLLVQQTRGNFLFSPEATRGLHSPGLKGTYTPEDAARQLLDGTPLEVIRDPVGALIIRQKVAQVILPAPRQAPELRPAALAAAVPALPPPPLAPAPLEEVLITGSLIHGAPAVGVPVTTLGAEEFRQTGALTVADALRSVPSVVVLASTSITNGGNSVGRQTGVDIHGLTTRSPRTLLLFDGMRYPGQAHGTDMLDPSIIPTLAVERLDVLADGASATYGSDAVAGVVNVILKRNYDGAMTQLRAGKTQGGNEKYQFAQLYGRSWDTGNITLSYEYYDEKSLPAKERDTLTYDYTPWGLDDRTPVRSAIPGIVSTGAPSTTTGPNCTNCYSVPAGQNGVGLTWTTLLGNKGSQNLINPYALADAIPAQQRNAATLTFDQSIFDGVDLFATGFYSNRRSQLIFPPTITAAANNSFSATVPTTNPFYPIGAPAGLRINYSIVAELPPIATTSQISQRWSGGVNLDLPYEWNGQIFYSANEEKNRVLVYNAVNLNHVAAALGNTVAAVGPSGTIPGQAAFIKPANVPFLNVFCDPFEFTCNSKATLDYIKGIRDYNVSYNIREWGGNFDGPVLDLPGGPIRAAVGANYVSHNFVFVTTESYNKSSTALGIPSASIGDRQVWAVYGQLNVPVFGPENAIPGFQRLELEAAYRYDDYSDFGSTKNPKFAFNWMPISGLTFRGTWGTSFRAPAFADTASVAGVTVQPINTAAGATSNGSAACATVGGTPVAGSAAAILNPTCSAALQFPGGLAVGGGAGGAAVLRPPGSAIGPETATNYGLGFTFAPDWLPGFDMEATYFNIQLEDLIQPFPLTVGAGLNDPSTLFTIIFPTDPKFNEYVTALLAAPTSQFNPSFINNIRFINDASVRNAGSQLVDGIDFSANYFWAMGNWGNGNAGISGTYFLRKETIFIPGGTPVDIYDVNGQTQETRFKYRARLGWDNGDWSATVFANYQSHYINTQPLPPASVLVNFPDYSNLQPAYVTLDFSLGYDTGDAPTNDYLDNINIQFVANNFMDQPAPFMYRVNTTGGNPAAFDTTLSPIGRTLTVVVTKTW